MGLTVQLSDLDLGFRGFISGDPDPGITQLGLLSKLRLADDQNQDAIQATYATFKSHDHSVNGGELGAILTGTTRADSFQNDAFTNAKLGNGSVTSAATLNGTLQSSKILDGSIPKAKLGAATKSQQLFANAGPGQFTHGLGRKPMFCLYGNNTAKGFVAITDVDDSKIYFTRKGSAPLTSVPFYIVYR